MTRRPTPVLAVIALLTSVAAAPPAHAAFPGRNGVIAFNGANEVGGKVRQGVFAMYPRTRRIRHLIAESRRRGLPTDPQFSPGGRMLAFEYGFAPDGNDPPDVWLRSVSRRSRARRMIAKPPGTDFHVSPDLELLDRQPDWSPDGKSIVFERMSLFSDERRFEPSELRIYHRGHSRPLVLDGEDAKWSVRNEIAFVRLDDDSLEGTIHIIRPDGTGERRLVRGADPDWSPDGRRLVFVTPGQQIATISRSGRRLRRVTRDRRCPGTSPVFSPGGGQIAFIRWPDENPRCPTEGLVVSRTNGRHLRRLTRGDQVTNQAYVDWQPLRRGGSP